MPLNDDIKKYGAEDFERYHSGKMTALEMHALEKAALDDPFLSDALDGYANTQSPVADMNELKEKLHQKENNNKVIWFKRSGTKQLLRIAAILILFGGFAWLLYENNKIKNNEIAEVTDKSIIKETPVVTQNNTAADSTKAPQPALINTETASGSTVQQQIVTLDVKPVGVEKSSITTAKAPEYEFTTNQLSSGTAVTPITDSISGNVTASYYSTPAEGSVAYRDSMSPLAGKLAGVDIKNSTTFKGRVLNNSGLTLSNATITDKKNNRQITAGYNGTFALSSNDSAPLVAVNARGYASTTMNLKMDSNANNIVLQNTGPSDAFAVVNGYQVKRKNSNWYNEKNEVKGGGLHIPRVTITNAIPINGWREFNKYIADSLKNKEQLGKTAVTAEVLVSFNVNDKGEPVDISAQRSLCSACDEEAIRIIKNGPAWKLNNRRKKANAVVKF